MSAAVRISLLETFGLDPLPLRAREAWLAVRGDASVPPTRFGLSSLGIFHPALSLKTWLGGRRADRRVPISCLFDRDPDPPRERMSVRKTQVVDFRGGSLTYDSHNGTDFAVPVGTVVVAGAPGSRSPGAFRTCTSTSGSTATTSTRSRRTARRASGRTATTRAAQTARSRRRRRRDPHRMGSATGRGGDRALQGCRVLRGVVSRDRPRRARDERAVHANKYPTRFEGRPALYRERHAREPWLTLPFRADDFDGVAFAS